MFVTVLSSTYITVVNLRLIDVNWNGIMPAPIISWFGVMAIVADGSSRLYCYVLYMQCIL